MWDTWEEASGFPGAKSSKLKYFCTSEAGPECSMMSGGLRERRDCQNKHLRLRSEGHSGRKTLPLDFTLGCHGEEGKL